MIIEKRRISSAARASFHAATKKGRPAGRPFFIYKRGALYFFSFVPKI